MRRTASSGIVALGIALALAGCKGAAYEPYNGPNGGEQPAAATTPQPAAQTTSDAQAGAPAQPSPPPPAPEPPRTPVPKKVPTSIKLTSPSFSNGHAIPSSFTCDGFDGPPPLAWTGVPAGTRELVITMEDPKGSKGRFTHWTLFGLKPSLTRLPADHLPKGAHQGRNDFNQIGYGGPCPGYTEGTHHYVIMIYALNGPLPPADGPSPDDVRSQIKGSTLAKGRLTGTYRRRA